MLESSGDLLSLGLLRRPQQNSKPYTSKESIQMKSITATNPSIIVGIIADVLDGVVATIIGAAAIIAVANVIVGVAIGVNAVVLAGVDLSVIACVVAGLIVGVVVGVIACVVAVIAGVVTAGVVASVIARVVDGVNAGDIVDACAKSVPTARCSVATECGFGPGGTSSDAESTCAGDTGSSRAAPEYFWHVIPKLLNTCLISALLSVCPFRSAKLCSVQILPLRLQASSQFSLCMPATHG